MNCRNCGRANRAGARFCGRCGSPLAPRCPACGNESAPDAQYCDACGAALVARPTDAAVARKVVPRRRAAGRTCSVHSSGRAGAPCGHCQLADSHPLARRRRSQVTRPRRQLAPGAPCVAATRRPSGPRGTSTSRCAPLRMISSCTVSPAVPLRVSSTNSLGAKRRVSP